MAIQTIRIDDYDKQTTDGVRPVTFSLDGDRYTLDLGPESLKALREALKPFIRAAPDATSSVNHVQRLGAGKWKREKYGTSGRLDKDQAAEWDALPESEKAKYR